MRNKLAILVVVIEIAAAAAALWFLFPDYYHVAKYRVEVGGPSPASCVPFAALAAVLFAGIIFVRRGSTGPAAAAVARNWLPLLVNVFIPARAALGAKPFFLEPLIFALSLAAALFASAFSVRVREGQVEPRLDRKEAGGLSVSLLLAAAASAAIWFYFVQAGALSKLVLGYADAGIYYLRIKNTAIGRGFLQETLARPPFYDHFDAGLLVLVPLWWLFKSYKTVMWAQGVFLAAAGAAVYVYARGRGLRPWVAFAFGAIALLYPSISQMSLSFSYGFHPATLAIPAVILSMHFWEKRRWTWFGVAALFAMSMEETIIPFYIGMGLVELAFGRGNRLRGLALAGVSAAAFVVVTRIVMPEFAGSERYFQMAKFAHLGKSAGEILLSPFTKPAVFWGLVLSRQSLEFLAILLGSLGFLPIFAPRQLLYPVIVIAFVLALQNPDVRGISFQYQAMIVAAWLPAAVAGAEGLSSRLASRRLGNSGAAIVPAAAGALAAAFVMSHFYGMLPWSRATVPFQMRQSEEFTAEVRELRQFAGYLPKSARVLATMRTAALFVEALEVAPLQEWTGRTDYDVVVLQPGDQWGARQTPDEQRAVFEAMAGTGAFEAQTIGPFVVLTRRPPGAPQ